MQKYFMLVAVLTLCSFMHPIHVSVCDIEFDQERKAIEIVQRVFLDDIENAIRKRETAPHLDITQPDNGKTTDEMIQSYLVSHFKIKINDTPRAYHYLGHEIEGDALYVYMEIEKVKELKSITVFSDILTEVFDDQVNLVHIEVEDDISSMKLTPKHTIDTISYNGG